MRVKELNVLQKYMYMFIVLIAIYFFHTPNIKYFKYTRHIILLYNDGG